jgi:ribosomal protein S18 acetylase RimI-like enzyme
MAFEVRALDKARDRREIEAIDTGFETDTIFELVVEPRSLTLRERKLHAPRHKAYSIREVFAPWAGWKQGWVAVAEGVVRGFAAVEHEPWHQRINLWFLYVQPDYRRQGLGRALLAEVEAYGRSVNASHVWLETSNVNVPGVRAYERLGYALCGADTRYYGKYMPGETALYLAKDLSPEPST